MKKLSALKLLRPYNSLEQPSIVNGVHIAQVATYMERKKSPPHGDGKTHHNVGTLALLFACLLCLNSA